MRILKSRISEATLRPMPDLGLTRVEIPRLNAGWRAGQHVRIRVISSGMGLLGWSEIHPFTIASVGGDGMLLMCKKTGSWTTKLYNMATSSSPAEKNVTSRNVKVILEGPYGGIGHTLMDTFSGAVFIVGGSGITFALASVQDLIQKDIDGKSNVKVVDLVWCVQNPGMILPSIFED
jgi:ferric-chelate reductase